MMKTLIIFICGAMTPLFALALFFVTGIFDVGAIAVPSSIEKALAQFVVNRSVSLRAPNEKVPSPTSKVLEKGLRHYQANCIMCHGAPSVDAKELAQGLYPRPPSLELEMTQKKSDGMLYRIVSHGIRMTGMPGFSPTHNEEELWNVVSFLRHLPNLTEEEKHILKGTNGPLEKETSHHH